MFWLVVVFVILFLVAEFWFSGFGEWTEGIIWGLSNDPITPLFEFLFCFVYWVWFQFWFLKFFFGWVFLEICSSVSWGEEDVEKDQLPNMNWEQHVEAHDQFLNQKKFLISNFIISLPTQKPIVQGQDPMSARFASCSRTSLYILY